MKDLMLAGLAIAFVLGFVALVWALEVFVAATIVKGVFE